MAKRDFDLDDLKKTWQEQEVQEQYDVSEIESMLNKKSRNYVKYIFWISVAEFLVFSAISIGYFLIDRSAGDTVLSLEEAFNIQFSEENKKVLISFDYIKNIIGFIIPVVFIYFSYRSYQKIKVEVDLKNFITQIVRFRRIVYKYIVVNIVFFILSFCFLTIYLSRILQDYNVLISKEMLYGFITALVVVIVIFLIIIGIYYLIIYGILMKRLSKNLQQLKKIESERDF